MGENRLNGTSSRRRTAIGDGPAVRFALTAQLALASTNPITTFQAIVLGLLQGVSELFPV